MYKKSIYNRVLPLNDNTWYIHNILSSSECILFDKEKRFFENINEETTDDYLISLRKQWFDMGFFVMNGFDEKSSLLLERKINIYSHMKDYSGFVIAPTMDCNARCFYCYENDTRASIYLSDETARDIVKYIKDNTFGKKKLFISWFGGEPLMCMNHLTEISDELIDFCQKNGIEFDSEITTNGYFLQENIDKLKQSRVSEIQVTLDGDEEEHLRRKRFINGQSVWKRIVDGIFEASKKGIHVTIRINFDQRNFENVLTLPETFMNDKRWNDNISLYYYPLEANSCGKCYGTIDEDEYKNYFSIIHKKFNEIGYYDKQPSALSLRKRSMPCYSASLATVAIDCYGNIYHCQHQLCREGQSIGNVRDGIILNRELVEWFDGTLPDVCSNCEVLPLCQGGCVTKRNYGQTVNLCHNIKYSLEAIEQIKAERIKKQFNL